MSIKAMIVRLATRGLVPCPHNLTIWQHADGSGWGAGITTPYSKNDIDVSGESLEEALKNLMVAMNRGADL